MLIHISSPVIRLTWKRPGSNIIPELSSPQLTPGHVANDNWLDLQEWIYQNMIALSSTNTSTPTAVLLADSRKTSYHNLVVRYSWQPQRELLDFSWRGITSNCKTPFTVAYRMETGDKESIPWILPCKWKDTSWAMCFLWEEKLYVEIPILGQQKTETKTVGFDDIFIWGIVKGIFYFCLLRWKKNWSCTKLYWESLTQWYY